MGYLLLGAILLIASIGGLWFSLPVDGQMRAFARQGRDVYIAIAITGGVGIGLSALIVGLAGIQG
jgi:hypothetical protein